MRYTLELVFKRLTLDKVFNEGVSLFNCGKKQVENYYLFMSNYMR